MGRDSTAWGSPFNLDSSAQLPGLGEAQTTLPLPTPSTPAPNIGAWEEWGRAGNRMGEEDAGPEAPLTSSLLPTCGTAPTPPVQVGLAMGPTMGSWPLAQPKSPLTQEGEKKDLARIQKPI